VNTGTGFSQYKVSGLFYRNSYFARKINLTPFSVGMVDRDLIMSSVRIVAEHLTQVGLNKDGEEVGIDIREPQQ